MKMRHRRSASGDGDSDWRTEVEIKTAEKELGIQQKCNAMQCKKGRRETKDGGWGRWWTSRD